MKRTLNVAAIPAEVNRSRSSNTARHRRPDILRETRHAVWCSRIRRPSRGC